MNHDVFISHAKEDKSVAEEMCQSLEKKGIKCWMAPRDIRASANYQEEIVTAIKAAKIMVVILSHAANDSPFVPKEVERAITNRVNVLPFRIEDISPGKSLELFLSSSQWLDAMTWPMEQHFERLAENICKIIPDHDDIPQRFSLNQFMDRFMKQWKYPAAWSTYKKKHKTAYIVTMTLVIIGLIYAIGIENQPPPEQPQPIPLPFTWGFTPTSYYGQPCFIFTVINTSPYAINGVSITVTSEFNGNEVNFYKNKPILASQRIDIGPMQNWFWKPGDTVTITASGYQPFQLRFPPQ